MANTTIPLPFPTSAPAYYFDRPHVFDSMSDQWASLAAPIIAYWGLSLFFHWLDMSEWKWLDKYRIHDSAEVKSRNLVSRWDVLVAVVFQHIVQTGIGYLWLEGEHPPADPIVGMSQISNLLAPVAAAVLGTPRSLMYLPEIAYYVYWWAIPAAQLFGAMMIIDTWQYFLHRLMHENKWLYRQFHSWHHRLYVPYAFGALYNHPVEGFLLDTVGAGIAEAVTGMSVRQAMVLFTISTLKTVDDHCGYKLPFDPLQMVTSNNADYHDIHHQTIGIKSNYAQPFFVHWDTLLGTRMTRHDLAERKKLRQQKAQKAE
ncbi:fatty acid hydroxylase superfamily-domain-containing protein [Schizophyllum amplum]|uniref:Fatty acid hydroxylase superfamily-domain-containing protein n=1 Tax=Schizophyllum amplum TaxID=97359 RepID=A0A550CKE0_9AGAR|nr:fatty acid hydroxylase superfamily-domain-containing protein [Auriculariopsis ampla]